MLVLIYYNLYFNNFCFIMVTLINTGWFNTFLTTIEQVLTHLNLNRHLKYLFVSVHFTDNIIR